MPTCALCGWVAVVSVWVSGLSGVCSGVLCAALLQPLDVVKTALINPAYGEASLLSLSRRLVREEGGFARLWRGLGPAVARIGLGSATYFTTQSTLINAVQQQRSSSSSSSQQQLSEESQSSTTAVQHCLIAGLLYAHRTVRGRGGLL